MADLGTPTIDQSVTRTFAESLTLLCDVGPAEYVGPNTAKVWELGLLTDEEYAARLNAAEWRANVEHLIYLFLGADRRDYMVGGKFWKTMRYGAAYTAKGVPLTDAALITRVRKLIA